MCDGAFRTSTEDAALIDGNSVLVASADGSVAVSLRTKLSASGIPAEIFRTAADLLHAIRDATPGCIVVDIDLPDFDCNTLLKALRDRAPGVPVLITSRAGNTTDVVATLRAGATDYIPVSGDAAAVARIRAALDEQVQAREARARRALLISRLERLTPREREVLRLLMDGVESKAAALELGISRKTVDVHRMHILTKMGAGSIVELVRLFSTADVTALSGFSRRELR